LSQDRKQYRKAQLKALEWEVRLYEQTKEELDIAKDDIILAGHRGDDGMPRGTDIGDTTGNLALKLLTSYQIREMEKRIKAIERAKDEFCAGDSPLKSAYLHLYFWNNRYTADGIALKIGIARATVFNWRTEFLNLVGRYLGWRV
jgi:hypothetical protein